jgi:hypothetical protein
VKKLLVPFAAGVAARAGANITLPSGLQTVYGGYLRSIAFLYEVWRSFRYTGALRLAILVFVVPFYHLAVALR